MRSPARCRGRSGSARKAAARCRLCRSEGLAPRSRVGRDDLRHQPHWLWLAVDGQRIVVLDRPACADETAALAGEPSWTALSGESKQLDPAAREIEWFAFGGCIYRRERLADNVQILTASGEPSAGALRQSLSGDEVDKAISRIAGACETPTPAPEQSSMPGAPVYRVKCGSTWFDVDSASGAIVEKLDPSRRTYRWLYRALHTLDFPGLAEAPIARTIIVVALCCFGFVFSVTGIALAWNRLASERR